MESVKNESNPFRQTRQSPTNAARLNNRPVFLKLGRSCSQRVHSSVLIKSVQLNRPPPTMGGRGVVCVSLYLTNKMQTIPSKCPKYRIMNFGKHSNELLEKKNFLIIFFYIKSGYSLTCIYFQLMLKCFSIFNENSDLT